MRARRRLGKRLQLRWEREQLVFQRPRPAWSGAAAHGARDGSERAPKNYWSSRIAQAPLDEEAGSGDYPFPDAGAGPAQGASRGSPTRDVLDAIGSATTGDPFVFEPRAGAQDARTASMASTGNPAGASFLGTTDFSGICSPGGAPRAQAFHAGRAGASLAR